jgi:non-lysosomal glucosylceramidase
VAQPVTIASGAEQIHIARQRTFVGQALVEVAFPLGGIGTGNVSLGGRGQLRDWEIFNHAYKGRSLPNTFFAIRTQAGSRTPVAKVLEAPLLPPHALSHGYHPWTAGGLPRMAGATFRGEYPFATVDFDAPDLPVRVRIEAFTPLIPLAPEDSGIPCAILTYTVANTSADPVALTLIGSLINPVGGLALDPYGNLVADGVGQNVNEARDEAGLRGVFLRSEKFGPGDLSYGDLSLATTHPNVTIKRAWLRGAWYDFLREFWDDFSSDGRLDDLGYETPSEAGKTDTASLGLVDTLAPGEQKDYRFILAWFFPNRPNSWSRKKPEPMIRNHYATRFDSSWAVARYVVAHMARLEGETRRFHAALFDSTLPPAVLDAISANIVPLRSPTCFWLEDGRFFGYEGCFDDGGCCDGTCTHVWSYAQTVAFLFPSLEREMRRIEFVVETEDDGYMTFRTYKTFGEEFIWIWGDQKPEAAADGQMGSILRVYREWLLSADRAWLKLVWPGVKRAIVYASSHWDTDRDGVLDGRQHNTYDIEFYGPNPLCGIYYLAGLRAVEELARVMGEPDLAERCRATFARGSQRLDELLWNGEYYIQRLDDVDSYKYQHGAGCLSDQLLGQLHARILGLGDLLPSEHVRTALGAIFQHNFKRDFRNHVNCQRTYVLNDEAGLILCTWPRGGRPRFPFVYSDEVWTGFEYQVAAHLIYEGRVDEGLTIVEALRARHDGVRRNPWNEVECGHHYARSMASWALLLALSGFTYDAAAGAIGFAPARATEPLRCFFSTGTGWGSFAQQADGGELRADLTLQYGSLRLEQVTLRPGGPCSRVSVTVGDETHAAELTLVAEGVVVRMAQLVALRAGDVLTVRLE